jgi:hypothetical protein
MKFLTTILMSLVATSFVHAAPISTDPINISARGALDFRASNFGSDDCLQKPNRPPGVPGDDQGGPVRLTPVKMICDNSHPHLIATLTYDGSAADETFNGMNDVAFQPGVSDILTRDPNTLSWNDLPSKRGKDVYCYKKPVKTNGVVALATYCMLSIQKLNLGQF